jgi:hypothetical protein
LDLRLSRLPTAVGLCASDTASIAQIANSAESRLILAREAGDEGWYGSFAEMAFSLSRATPYVTMPRNVARIEATAVCEQPVALNNQFYEYLRFGNGRLPKVFHREGHRMVQAFARNNAPGFVDLTNPPQYIVVYLLNPADATTRVFVQGTDPTGADIYTIDGANRVKGVFCAVNPPFTVVSDSSGNPIPFNSISGYQKGGTLGAVQFFQMDPTTGNQVLLHTMEPGETTGWYRRYYFHNLPWNCCGQGGGPPCSTPAPTPPQVQISAIVKLDPVPVTFDTDYLLIQSIEALIEEAQSVRYLTMDTSAAKGFALQHHRAAISFLNGQLSHAYGKDSPAVEFAPFGSARLEKARIGTLI